MSVAKGTNEVLRLYIALSGLKDLGKSLGEGRDKILSSMPQLLTEPAGIYERYTAEPARTCDLLLRKHGKSIADRQHTLKRVADIAIDPFVGLAGFILDKGSYPWDVVS